MELSEPSELHEITSSLLLTPSIRDISDNTVHSDSGRSQYSRSEAVNSARTRGAEGLAAARLLQTHMQESLIVPLNIPQSQDYGCTSAVFWLPRPSRPCSTGSILPANSFDSPCPAGSSFISHLPCIDSPTRSTLQTPTARLLQTQALDVLDDEQPSQPQLPAIPQPFNAL